MSESNTTPIGAVASCFTGYPFDSKSFLGPSSGDARVFRGDNLKEGYSEWGEKERRWAHITTDLERFQLKEGDILVGMDGSKVGKNWTKVICGDLPALLGQRVCRIRAGENADQNFLYHVFGSTAFRSYVERVKTGTSIPHISNEQIKDFCLPIPPLPEQKKIAEILSGIDKELAICQENLSRTNLLRTSLLKRMMDDAEEESLEKSLGSVVEVINGRAYKLTEWENEGTPVIRLQNLTKQGGSFYYSNLRLPEKQYCEKGDLLFMWSASFGPHIWWGEKAIYHYHIWKMVPKCNSLLKDYLYLFLQYKTEEWKSQGAGMAMIHLTKEGIEKEVIPLPPVTSQERVVNTIKSIDNLIEETKAKAAKISLLKSAISADLLSGRKRVSV